MKTVTNLPVRGDGITDDTANINSVLLQCVGKVVYFPAGTYMVTDSLIIPPGSRIVGDAYASAISAAFSTKFLNPDAPTAMVKLGNPGDVGVGQISDMLSPSVMYYKVANCSKLTWPAISLARLVFGTLISVSVAPQGPKSRRFAVLLPINAWLLGV